MSSPAITNKLFQLKKNKPAAKQQPVDPEVLALLNQIDLGDQNVVPTSGPATSVRNNGPVNPRQIR